MIVENFPVDALLSIHLGLQTKTSVGIHSCGCGCNERLKVKTDGSTRLTYTWLSGELKHLKVETRLIGESFECLMGECVN